MRYTAAWVVFALLGAGGCKSTENKPALQAPTPAPAPKGVTSAEPFPSSFNYPLPAAELEAAVAARDIPLLRKHGWYLFAGANSSASNGLPIWRTWPTSTNAYAPAKASDAAALGTSVDAGRKRARSLIQVNADNLPVNLANLPQYPLPEAVCRKYFSSDTCPGSNQNYFSAPDGQVFQSNGDIMIAGVIYNEPAFEWIRNGGGQALFEADVLTRMLPAKGQFKQVASFPSSAIVIKHMYWPVPGDGCGALPVWDNPTPPSPSAYMGYETWARAVAVATAGCKVAPGGTTQVSFLQGVQDAQGKPLPTRVFPNAKVVPLSSFYHQTFTQAALDALSANDRALLDASASWSYGRGFQAGDSIISIAMHIFTKEMPTWTMQSFWWHDQPDQGPYAANRPNIPLSQSPDTWRNYLMVIEDGIPDLQNPQQLPVHFNPYIELVIHPVATNCRNCHQRAAWPRSNTGLSPSSAYQLKSGDPGLLTNLRPDDSIFKSLLLLDMQWAMADRAITSGTQASTSGK